jgi:dipeptidyl aminopeptidase/acylaminoacyl peptidase
MNDRWPWYRTHSHLYSLSVRSGSLVRLTAGKWTIWGPSIRFDGKKALFVRNRADYKDRPFSNNTLYELDLQTLKTTKLLDNLRWLWSFSYSPDGKQVLFRGGPSLFGKLGYHPTFPKKGIEQNQYNGELYIYDIKSKTKTALTHTFGPSVNVPYWHPRDKHIYFTALDKTRVRLYQYDVKDKSFTEIATGVDLVGRVSFARHTSRITYVGVGVTHPHRLYTLDLDKPLPQVIAAPSKKRFQRVALGAVKPWNTVSKQGTKIKGRVYYPPGFDAKKKYPALVYYYGGTYPTTRGFDGRYPAHLWAAHGYVVYILQPSGALGFGQAFAAKHTAEWGTIVPGEIISSTRAFLKAHPFVNPKRVGCLGASYGGFTTMSVVTKTSLFAAAISHAGISNITSYWGAGYWGFLYSSISAAHKYPWSHKRYFIKQSPLFSAHKVTTPLLLIHGTNDNNVPPAESYQMYTALRILKKPVELITFKREGHWILSYRKRLLWTQTIIAWFDKHLNKQPRWFNTLHGTRRR